MKKKINGSTEGCEATTTKNGKKRRRKTTEKKYKITKPQYLTFVVLLISVTFVANLITSTSSCLSLCCVGENEINIDSRKRTVIHFLHKKIKMQRRIHTTKHDDGEATASEKSVKYKEGGGERERERIHGTTRRWQRWRRHYTRLSIAFCNAVNNLKCIKAMGTGGLGTCFAGSAFRFQWG